jgi:hypothetical protein
MRYIARLTLFFFVALAICLAQTKNCWPRIDESPFMSFVEETIALCAAWLIYEAFRPLMGQTLNRGIGIALFLLGLVGGLWGLVLFAMAGFSMWGSVPAAEIAQGQLRGILFIVPSALLMVSAGVSFWGTRNLGRQNVTK